MKTINIFKRISLLTIFLLFLTSCSSSGGNSSAVSSGNSSAASSGDSGGVSSKGSRSYNISITGSSSLSTNKDELTLEANANIEEINDASIAVYIGGTEQGSNSFSVASGDNNSIIITFINLPEIESDASIVLSQGAFTIRGVPSNEQTIYFFIDTKRPTASSTPSAATGTFDATVTFSENFSKVASGDIISSDFSYTGFSTTPEINVSQKEIFFSGLRFSSPTATISLAAGIIEDELGNTNNAITWNFTNNAPAPALSLTGSATISSSQNTLTFTSSENIDDFSSNLISLSGISGINWTATKNAARDISISFSNLPFDTENNFSLVFAKRVVTSSGQPSNATSFAIRLDTLAPQVESYSPTSSNGVFNATVTFSENFSKVASGNIISSDFSYTGFSATPDSLIISGREIVFSNLRFSSPTASISLAAGITKDELGNTNNAITLDFTNSAPIPTLSLSSPFLSTKKAFLNFTSSENIDSLDSSLISLDSSLSLSVSATNNNIRLNFPNIPDSTESNFSISFSEGVIYSSGQPSNATSFAITIDTLAPQVESHTPTSATGVFNATVTFSEQVYNDISSTIDENNFTLSGFADNDIAPIITISSGRTVALFNNLSFAAADTLTATISLNNIQDEVGNQLTATRLSISNLLGPAVRSGDCSGIDFDGGSGSAQAPYQISNLCQLQNMGVTSDNHLVLSSLLSSHYELTAKIDASWTKDWNLRSGFTPIGINNTNAFRGSFNGNDYRVDALFTRFAIGDVGLFGRTNGANIRNARLTNVDIQGSNYTGGLVGCNTNNSIIQNSSAAGSVSGNQYVGGLVGFNVYNSIIQNSSSSGSVSGTSYVGGLVGSDATSSAQGNQYVGGLVGINAYNSIIQNSSSAGSVSGINVVGGLVGTNGANSTVRNSYATSLVSGNDDVGGLVGSLFNNSTIQNSYAMGSVSGNNDVGGLLGVNNSTSAVQNSFSAGSAQGNHYVGGFLGRDISAFYQNNYWNNETSGQNTSASGDARTSSQFLSTTSLFSGSDGTWDYGDNLSYPTLSKNAADATTQHLHQSAYMIRLADNDATTGFWGNTHLQQDFTMNYNAIPTEQDATIFAFDVNAEAPNDSARVDFWDCATGSDTGILLTTSSVNNASITLQYGEENTIEKTAFEKGTGSSCEIVRTATGTVSAGDVLHLEAVVSKGSGTGKRSYTRSFKLTLE